MKKIITLSLVLLMCFMLSGCGKEEGNNINPNNQSNVTGLEIGEYQVTKKGNSIFVVTNDGASMVTTEYKFSDNKLTEATLTQKYANKDLAKTMYDQMISLPQITAQYDDVSLKDDSIILKFKDTTLVAYTNFDQNQVYDLMLETYGPYIKK